MSTKPVLFLDCDGVMNCIPQSFIDNPAILLPLELSLIKRFCDFADEIDAIVVMSSAWRKTHNLDYFKRRFPRLIPRFHEDWRTGVCDYGHRGNEVLNWCEDHGWPPHVIFDDDRDFYTFQPFVRTEKSIGLSDANLQFARNLLKAQGTKGIAPFAGIAYKHGDLITAPVHIIAHQVNAQGRMASGVAKAIRAHFPGNYETYRAAYEAGKLQLGAVIWHQDSGSLRFTDPYLYEPDTWIANIVGQDRYGYDGGQYTDYSGLKAGLTTVAQWARKNGFYEVGVPKIGAGLGGGDWQKISSILEEVGKRENMCFTVFIPDVIEYEHTIANVEITQHV
jgi:O-acetyl-ADP-ribose deacetylase (regulator of RNase III)